MRTVKIHMAYHSNAQRGSCYMLCRSWSNDLHDNGRYIENLHKRFSYSFYPLYQFLWLLSFLSCSSVAVFLNKMFSSSLLVLPCSLSACLFSRLLSPFNEYVSLCTLECYSVLQLHYR